MTSEAAAPAQQLTSGVGLVARPRAAERVLWITGALLVSAFLAATARIPLHRWFPDAGVSLGFPQIMSDDWRRNALEYAGFVAVTFGLYAVALFAVWRGRPRVRTVLVFGFPVLFCAALVFMYPPTAADVFHYHADARTMWVFDRNPLTVAPAATGYVMAISWADQPSPYGPLWTLLTAPVAIPAGDHWYAGLLGFKLLASLSLLSCVWLVYRLVRRTRPGWELVAVVLFAWNPFVLVRVAGNGHNDLVMMFFVLLSLERAERRDWLCAFPALTAGVLVKFAPVLLGPPLLLFALWQSEGDLWQRVRGLVPAAVVSVALAVLVYAPFWAGTDTFAVPVDGSSNKMITSLPMLIQFRLETVAGMANDSATAMAKYLTRGLFLLLYLPLVWQARRDFTRLVGASATVLFLYLLIAAGWYRPWYVLWPLVLLALLTGSWYTVLFLALSFANAFPDLVEQYRMHWEWLAVDGWRAFAAPVVTQSWLPVLIWWLGLLLWKTWFFDTTGSAARPGLEHPS